MASLKEIKGRIDSVNSTLKITSAMKLVASAKLRKAQNAIGNMLPYETQLHRILVHLLGSGPVDWHSGYTSSRPLRKVALVVFSSNTSLCGAFNSNVIRKALSVIDSLQSDGVPRENISVFPIGKKVADALQKAGFSISEDYSRLADKPDYSAMASLTEELMDGFVREKYDKVVLVYNHYKSTASQIVTEHVLLPLDTAGLASEEPLSESGSETESENSRYIGYDDYIVEPDRAAQIDLLLPKVLKLKTYTVLLDSNAAEHAARTVAMQTASDNGKDLLDELTMDYNKGRQQKITNEILDLVGGTLD